MKNPKIKIKVAYLGEMTFELYPKKAPLTVENFLSLIEEGFFTNTIFHRVIKNFVIQGGGYDVSGKQKKAHCIKGEFASNGCNSNDVAHVKGVLSMARTMDPNSASSQFFIMHGDAPHLDSQYAAFGMIIDGMEVVDKIASMHTDRFECPKENVIIETIEVMEDDKA